MVKWIRRLAVCVLLAFGCGNNSATPTPTPTPAAGCAKDSDCKGDRICVSGACVDARKETATAAPVPTVAVAPAPEHHVPPVDCGVSSKARFFGYVNPPPGKEHAIVRNKQSPDASELGRLPWGTEVEVITPDPGETWHAIYCPRLWKNGAGWIHKDVLKVGEHAPAQRP